VISNMRNRFWIIAAPITFLEGLILYFHMRNDPEPYHSGFVYAQSVATSQGILPNRHFLSPYGITGSFLNGALFKIVEPTMLNLLLFYGLLTIIIGLILYRSIYKIIGHISAFSINLVWVLTFVTNIPWPSLLTTLLTISAFYLLNQIHLSADELTPGLRFRLITVALLLQLAILTRIHLMVATLLVSIIIFFFARRSVWSKWIKYNLIIGGTFVAGLFIADLLPGYLEQVIVWPLTGFSSPPMTLGLYLSFFWFPFLSALIYFLHRVILKIAIIQSHKKRFLSAIVLTVIVLCSVYSLASVNTSNAPPTIRSWLGFIAVLKSNFQVTLGFVTAFIVFIYLCATCVRLLPLEFSKRLKTNISSNQWFALAIGITALTQLFPLHDNVHIWFVTPLLVYAVIGFTNLQLISRRTSASILVMCSIMLSYQGHLFAKSAHIERVPLKSAELKGLYGTQDFAQVVDRTMLEIDKIGSSRSLRNECASALYAISNQKFVSIDGNYIGNFFEIFTEYMPIVDPQKQEPSFIFQCNSSLEDEGKILKKNYKVQFKIPILPKGTDGAFLYNVLYSK